MASRKITQFEKPTQDLVGDGKHDESKAETLTFMPKKKMVLMDKRASTDGVSSISRMSFFETVDIEMQRAIDLRSVLQIYETIGEETIDVTPKPINVAFDTDAYKKLRTKTKAIPRPVSEIDRTRSATSSMIRARSSRGVGVRLSMEDIIAGVGSERMLTEDLSPTTTLSPYIEGSCSSFLFEEALTKHRLPFIRVVLRKTELFLLYEHQSMTAIKNTEDGNFAEYDNKQYDYLTMGRGKVRRRSDGETQTQECLFKSRKINTLRKHKTDRASYVSYFEMYDTYKFLEEMGSSYWKDHKEQGDSQQQTGQRRLTPEQQFEVIGRLQSFHWASTVMKRLIAGNNYEMSLRRYRNMVPINRTVNNIDYKYSMINLFTISPFAPDNERRAVSDMSFCYRNNDILAVGYGIYSYQAAKMPTTGEVCIWSVKNTSDPERFYSYNYTVVSVEFSPYMPTLLAIGLFDGSVEVRDITNYNAPPIAVSQRKTSPGVDPVLAIKWIKLPDSNDSTEIDPFIALSQDGSVTRYRLINSPFLLGVKQMVLERIEGTPEGLQVKKSSSDQLQANPNPQGLNLTKHPLFPDIYYILTDEGCVHKCSTNYQHHYLEVLKTHEGSVNCMDFSPWSPKLFLTCGNDWRIRIWIEGMFKPLVTLQNCYSPYQWAAWSRTHSTVIVALNRKQCEIWDLRRSILKPVSTHTLASSYNTMALFSRDGNSIGIGNERGKVFLNTLDDMPFPPHYQYDALEKAIFTAVANYPDLMTELKSLGFFGYPQKAFVMPP